MTTVASLVAAGVAKLKAREGLPDPGREARFLVARLLDRPESWVLAHGDAPVTAATTARFGDWLTRRAAGEPAHYIVGSCPFWGREFLVTPTVLIPRPETELIVARALRLPLPDRPRLLDIGTGSGCLAVTLALELPTATVVGVDRSPAALAVARANAARLHADVTLLVTELAAPVRARFDLVVANLPYVPSGELGNLPTEIRDFEPLEALDGGSDGMTLLRALVADLPRLLQPGGAALLELGPGELPSMVTEAERSGLTETDRLVDIAGVERVLVLSRLPSATAG